MPIKSYANSQVRLSFHSQREIENLVFANSLQKKKNNLYWLKTDTRNTSTLKNEPDVANTSNSKTTTTLQHVLSP